MLFGVVSNCWSALLPGTSLREQCLAAAAPETGYRYVELRGGSLAECEEPAPAGRGASWPLPAALAALAAAVPGLGLNLAVEAPFLAVPLPPRGDAYLERCAAAAAALGGPRVLRLVDLTPAAALPSPAELEARAAAVADLATHLWDGGVSLALENSRLPVEPLVRVLSTAAALLPAGVPPVRLCWDPHNQVTQRLLPEDPLLTARELPIELLFEFHFKQGEPGRVDPAVGPGYLPWPAIVETLARRGYQGPALHELPPGPDIWERLRASDAWVRSLVPVTPG